MATTKLPCYTRPKRLASGAVAYFWELPLWARPTKDVDGKPAKAVRHGRVCPVESQTLGSDLAAAITQADTINALSDSWMAGEKSEEAKGTVAWLFGWHRR